MQTLATEGGNSNYTWTPNRATLTRLIRWWMFAAFSCSYALGLLHWSARSTFRGYCIMSCRSWTVCRYRASATRCWLSKAFSARKKGRSDDLQALMAWDWEVGQLFGHSWMFMAWTSFVDEMVCDTLDREGMVLRLYKSIQIESNTSSLHSLRWASSLMCTTAPMQNLTGMTMGTRRGQFAVMEIHGASLRPMQQADEQIARRWLEVFKIGCGCCAVSLVLPVSWVHARWWQAKSTGHKVGGAQEQSAWSWN